MSEAREFLGGIWSTPIPDFGVKNDRLQFDDTTFNSIKSILDHTINTALGALISDGQGDSVLLLGVSKSQLLAHSSDLLISQSPNLVENSEAGISKVSTSHGPI